MATRTSPLIVIVGPTASGKSDLAMHVAKQYQGEIINADSWQVYKGFDIGTAKPDKTDQNQVPHHLVDIADAKDGFNAALFKDLATKTIKDIAKRGKLPVLVGGTGLYIDSVIYDYGFLPNAGKEVRSELNNMTLDGLLKLAKNKNINTKHIDTRNKRRVIRAIEGEGRQPTKHKLRPNTLIIGLRLDKAVLADRVSQRVDQMLKAGLEDEVKRLSKKYGWQTEPMKGIGYREWQNYFKNTQSKEITRSRIVSATMQLIKKQNTWFKRNKNINWIHNFEQADALIKDFLSKNLLQ